MRKAKLITMTSTNQVTGPLTQVKLRTLRNTEPRIHVEMSLPRSLAPDQILNPSGVLWNIRWLYNIKLLYCLRVV